jgi:catechol-2,3-dioxygenase
MSLQHLHLHVRDRAIAERWYASWFDLRVLRRGSEITFMRDERDFLLALAADAAPGAMPPWFRFGFRLGSPQAVVDLHDRMAGSGVAIRKPNHQDDDLVSFRCGDPDGYVIEVYWEREDAAS